MEDYKRGVTKRFDEHRSLLDTIDANEVYFRKWIGDVEERVNVNEATTAEKFNTFSKSLFDLSILMTGIEDEGKIRLKETNDQLQA